MIRHATVTLVAMTGAVLTACAVGTNFVQPTADTLKLGETTYAQVLQKFGEPRLKGNMLINDKNVKTISYFYAAPYDEPLEAGVIPARRITYYFLDDTLVGHEFRSSFKSDNSNFDDTKISSIVKGRTTRAGVIQLLGKPTALYIEPMVKSTSGEAFGYTYLTLKSSRFSVSTTQTYRKALRLSFDEKGLISDIDFSTSSSGIK